MKKHLYWVFADLCAEKDTIKILSDLNKAYPFPNSDAERAEHEALGENNLAIVERAIKYMSEGDAEALGKLMTEAEALFDSHIAPMCRLLCGRQNSMLFCKIRLFSHWYGVVRASDHMVMVQYSSWLVMQRLNNNFAIILMKMV